MKTEGSMHLHTAAILIVVGIAISAFALSTAKKVGENRRLVAEKLQNYGEAIDVEGIDNLGRPTTIVLTSSTIESSKWSRFRSLMEEYAEAGAEVVNDAF